MIERYVKNREVLRRLRMGLAGPYLDGFAGALHSCGFSCKTAVSCLSDAAHLGVWCRRRGIPFTELGEDLLEKFRRHLPRCCCLGTKHQGYPCTVFRARRFVEYLRRIGVVTKIAPQPPPDPLLIQEYCVWLRSHRALAEKTVAMRRWRIKALIEKLGGDPTQYNAGSLRSFVLDRIRRQEPNSAPAITTAVRDFLRYLVSSGRCSSELIAAVPTATSWRLAKLPQYLAPAQVERIIGSCDVERVSGR